MLQTGGTTLGAFAPASEANRPNRAFGARSGAVRIRKSSCRFSGKATAPSTMPAETSVSDYGEGVGERTGPAQPFRRTRTMNSSIVGVRISRVTLQARGLGQ